jgi:hypothetical protein
MSSVPRFAPSLQEYMQAKALRLAVQLTPMQRHLVVRAGLPCWLALPTPWQPWRSARSARGAACVGRWR